MSTNKFSSKNKVERFAWAKPVTGEVLIVSGHPAFLQAANREVYPTLRSAIDDICESRCDGDRLHRITIEEVEVPEPSWWWVEQFSDNPPIANARAELYGEINHHISVSLDNNKVRRSARVLAADKGSAIAAAMNAWRDLAAKIGGAE